MASRLKLRAEGADEVQDDVKKCDCCGYNLIWLKWNKGSDMLVCDNVNCQKYRQPVGRNYGGKPSKFATAAFLHGD